MPYFFRNLSAEEPSYWIISRAHMSSEHFAKLWSEFLF